MAFRVDIALQAFEDIDAIAAYVVKYGSHESAARWFDGVIASIRTPSNLPSRCPLAQELDDLEGEVRLLLHGTRNSRYKIYFAIHGKTVASSTSVVR
jgi:hypothetical protein